MAYASIVAENTYTSVSSQVSTFDLTKPAGVLVNDLLMLLVACDDATSTISFAAKTGWTKQFEVGDAVPDAKIALYTRMANGTEGATETIDISSTGPDFAVGWYLVVRGADYRNGNTFIDIGSTATNSAATSLAAPAMLTGANESLVFACASYDGSDGGTFGVSGTGWTTTTRRYLATTSSSAGSSAAFVTKQAALGGQTTIACTFSASLSDGWSTIQFAIRPFVAQTVTATASASGTGTQTAFKLVYRSATDSGTGTQSASGVRIVDRTASNTGIGDATADFATYVDATAAAFGNGTSTATALTIAIRDGSSSGSGASSVSAFVTPFRTASSSGTGTETAPSFSIRLRTASSTGAGTENANQFKTPFRSVSSSGTSFQYADEFPTSVRFATGSGLGASSTTQFKTPFRTTSGLGTGDATGTRVTTYIRTASASGQASSVLTYNDVDTVYDFSMRNYDGGIGEATAFVIHVRDASGSGNSTEIAVHSRILSSGYWGKLI